MLSVSGISSFSKSGDSRRDLFFLVDFCFAYPLFFDDVGLFFKASFSFESSLVRDFAKDALLFEPYDF